jgi:DcuC family C4-dicarboxylate transporter
MTGTAAIVFSIVVLVATIYFLVKQFETRTVLLASGFAMAVAALAPMKAFSAFSTAMITGVLIQNICSTLGFAMVLQLTGCDKHLIHSVVKVLANARPIMIPGVAIATFCINIALPSAAGCAAAVGVIMIPLLVSQGIAPAMAASAVMMGTFGSLLSPGLMHNPIVAKLAKIDVMQVIRGHLSVTLVCLLIGALSLVIVAKMRKEDKGHQSDEFGTVDTKFAVNPLLAIIPIIPVTLLIIFSMDAVKEAMPWVKTFLVPHAMLLGAFLCIVCTRTNPQTAVKNFCEGMGKGYADVIGIIIAAGVFISGLNALGAIDAFIAFLKTGGGMVNVTAAYGPFLLAIVSGSADAATIAFNESVTPHAMDFGMQVSQMGSLANVSGALGRTMSPLAGATIICAGLGRVNPFEIAKRNAPGMLVASVACMIMLTYL